MKQRIPQWSLLILLLLSSNCLPLSAAAYDPSASVFRFQKQMAKRGNAESQYKLGLMYETGSGAQQNSVAAQTWYKKAAEQNYKPASNRLTYLKIKKSGFKPKHQQWLNNLKKDARFNEGEALFLLGQMYSEGTAVNKSLTRSLELLHKAAGGNIPGSETEIARVEQELTLLQKQYMSEENRKNIRPVSTVAVKKAVKTKPVVAIKKPQTPHKKPAAKPQTKKKAVKRKSAPPPKKQLASSKTAAPKKKPKAPLKAIPPAVQIEPEDSHPMDTICGGRNRFTRGCR